MAATERGAARFQRAVRDQMMFDPRSLDQLLPPDHSARTVWAFVQKLDLSGFYGQIKAVEGQAGRPPVDPAILVGLWLLATLDGVASARRVERLCTDHMAYRWLCGEVSVNHHLLSDFRTAHAGRLEKLLIDVVTTLLDKDLVTLNRVAQDGMRVRAAAGSASFRSPGRLAELHRQATEQVETLKRQADEDPGQADRRVQAARERAAREKLQRIDEALAQLPELEAKMNRRKKGDGARARCSTTDPDARRMKMADGGTRPAYNVELATTDETRIVTGVAVTNQGSDAGRMTPMVEQLETHYGRRPQELLADGGFATLDDITAVETGGTAVFAPVKEEEKKRAKGEDPFAPRPGDSPQAANWRTRMGTAAAQAIYQLRPSLAEFPNAVFRNHGLRQFLVRGLEKVKAVALWHALAFNLTRIQTLGWLVHL